MAGTKEIGELLDGAFDILNLAKKLGDNAWSFAGNTLTIKDPNLAKKVHDVIAGADQAALEREGADLGLMEIMNLAKRALSLIPRLLGH